MTSTPASRQIAHSRPTRAFLVAGVVIAAMVPARAAPAQAPPPRDIGDRRVGLWLGASPDSPTGGGLGGTTPGRRHLLGGLRAEWVIDVAGPVALAATADVVPLAIVTRTLTYRRVTVPSPAPDFPAFTIDMPIREAPVYGAGITPFGLALHARRTSRVRPFVAAAAGGLWFTRNTPVPGARRFNFTAEFGGGVELVRASGGSVVLAYRRHHLSNAGSARENPGLDGDVFTVGLFRRARARAAR